MAQIDVRQRPLAGHVLRRVRTRHDVEVDVKEVRLRPVMDAARIVSRVAHAGKADPPPAKGLVHHLGDVEVVVESDPGDGSPRQGRPDSEGCFLHSAGTTGGPEARPADARVLSIRLAGLLKKGKEHHCEPV